MGTNYYAEINVCDHCNKPEYKLHIGKSSCGWQFHFRGHEGISSFEDWYNFISDHNARIVDEYGTAISLDEFTSLVNSKRDEKLNHTDYVNNPEKNRGYNTDSEFRQHCWKDDVGNSFSDWEFS